MTESVFYRGDDVVEAKVVFTPSGRRGTFPAGTSILYAARQLGVDIDSVCGGRAICGRCQVVCSEGNFPKHSLLSSSDHLSGVSEVERQYSERTGKLGAGCRLSCQAKLLDDVVIDVPPSSQVHKQVIRKEAEARDIDIDPAVRLFYVEVEPPEMDTPKGDYERLLDALSRDWDLVNLKTDLHVLTKLQKALESESRGITLAIHRQTKIIAVWSGVKEDAYGAAIDLGSTTLAAHLCNLANGEVVSSSSIMNPQIRFGEDLMSRVSYVMMHEEGAQQLTEAVRQALQELLEELIANNDIDITDILEISLVGNPIMHHLVLGINPVELGGAPFALASDRSIELKALEIGLKLNPGTRLYILPCIAGHVGADAAGMILAEQPHFSNEMTLLVDVGTNAEIILGNDKRLLACSSPTGPAFEGAQISSGQRAAVGAIERIRIDRDTLEPRFRVIGCDLWSDEPGFSDGVEGFGVTGICGSGIIEAIAEMFLAGIISSDGVIDGELSNTNPRIFKDGRTYSYILHHSENDIIVSQTDVRQIQLAKAALYAGVKLLMDKMGVKETERIRLAGAFGSHISTEHAMLIGLLPDCDVENVSSAGNSAGTGARIALLSAKSREEIEDVVRRIEKIETAVESNFQPYFVEAMAFPNSKDCFSKIFEVIPPPKPKPTAPVSRSRRSRRSVRQIENS